MADETTEGSRRKGGTDNLKKGPGKGPDEIVAVVPGSIDVEGLGPTEYGGVGENLGPTMSIGTVGAEEIARRMGMEKTGFAGIEVETKLYSVGDVMRGSAPAESTLIGSDPESREAFAGFTDAVAREYEAYYPAGMSMFKSPGKTGSFPQKVPFREALEDLEYVINDNNHGGLDFERHCKFVTYLAARLPFHRFSRKHTKDSEELRYRDAQGHEENSGDNEVIRRAHLVLRYVALIPLDGVLGEKVEVCLRNRDYIHVPEASIDASYRTEKMHAAHAGARRERYEEIVKGDSLGFAAGRGDLVEVQRLLKAGISPSGIGVVTSDLPLVMAAAGGHTKVASLLLDAGANMDMVSRGKMDLYAGLSIQSVAAIESQKKFFDFIVDRGADPGVVMTQSVGAGTGTVYGFIEQQAKFSVREAEIHVRELKEKTAVAVAGLKAGGGAESLPGSVLPDPVQMLKRLNALGKGKGGSAYREPLAGVRGSMKCNKVARAAGMTGGVR